MPFLSLSEGEVKRPKSPHTQGCVCCQERKRRSDSENGGLGDEQARWKVLRQKCLPHWGVQCYRLYEAVDLCKDAPMKCQCYRLGGDLGRVIADNRLTAALFRHLATLTVHGAATGALRVSHRRFVTHAITGAAEASRINIATMLRRRRMTSSIIEFWGLKREGQGSFFASASGSQWSLPLRNFAGRNCLA